MIPEHGGLEQLPWVFESAAVLLERFTITTVGDLVLGTLPLQPQVG